MYGASVIGWDSVWLASLYLFPLPLSPISPQPSPSPTPTPVSASHQHHYHTQHQPSPSLPPSSLSSSSSSPVSCSTLFVANLELHHTEDEVANLFGKWVTSCHVYLCILYGYFGVCKYGGGFHLFLYLSIYISLPMAGMLCTIISHTENTFHTETSFWDIEVPQNISIWDTLECPKCPLITHYVYKEVIFIGRFHYYIVLYGEL